MFSTLTQESERLVEIFAPLVPPSKTCKASKEINMTNEFQSLSDGMVMEMYVKALHAYRSSPRIMPANDRWNTMY